MPFKKVIFLRSGASVKNKLARVSELMVLGARRTSTGRVLGWIEGGGERARRDANKIFDKRLWEGFSVPVMSTERPTPTFAAQAATGAISARSPAGVRLAG